MQTPYEKSQKSPQKPRFSLAYVVQYYCPAGCNLREMEKDMTKTSIRFGAFETRSGERRIYVNGTTRGAAVGGAQ
jgi:hypothetical protein